MTHIRDALWYARISKLVAAPAQTDLQRSTRLFYYVMRNIVLRSDEDTQLPMAPFGIAMSAKAMPATAPGCSSTCWVN